MTWWVCSVILSSPSDKRGKSPLPSSSSWEKCKCKLILIQLKQNWWSYKATYKSWWQNTKKKKDPTLPGKSSSCSSAGMKWERHEHSKRKRTRQSQMALIFHVLGKVCTGFKMIAIPYSCVNLPRSAIIPPLTGVFSLSFFRLTTGVWNAKKC